MAWLAPSHSCDSNSIHAVTGFSSLSDQCNSGSLYFSSSLSGCFKLVRIQSQKSITVVMGMNIKLTWSRKQAFCKWMWSAWRPTQNTQPRTGLPAWICTQHAVALGENPTSDVIGSCSARHTKRHLAPIISDSPGSDSSASVGNLSKVRASQHTNSS